MNVIKVCILLCLVVVNAPLYSRRAAIVATVGPKWISDADILKPSIATGPIPILVSQTSVALPYNIGCGIGAHGTVFVGPCIQAGLIIGGSFVRRGMGTAFSTTFNETVGRQVSVNKNGFDFDAEFIVNIPRLSMFAFKGGYKLGKQHTTLFFIQNPTIFFIKSKATGPYVGLEASLEQDNFVIKASYEFMKARLRADLTQNNADELVIQRAPAHGNFFALNASYKINEHYTIYENISFGRIRNTAIGSLEVIQPNAHTISNNVIQLSGAEIAMTTGFSYEF